MKCQSEPMVSLFNTLSYKFRTPLLDGLFWPPHRQWIPETGLLISHYLFLIAHIITFMVYALIISPLISQTCLNLSFSYSSSGLSLSHSSSPSSHLPHLHNLPVGVLCALSLLYFVLILSIFNTTLNHCSQQLSQYLIKVVENLIPQVSSLINYSSKYLRTAQVMRIHALLFMLFMLFMLFT